MEKCKISEKERQRLFEKRMGECEKLNELIKKENQDFADSVFDKPDFSTRENPFYLALKAQKEERDRYKQMLQLAIMSNAAADSETWEQQALPQEDKEEEMQDGANDIFKHTYVDIVEEENIKPTASQQMKAAE